MQTTTPTVAQRLNVTAPLKVGGVKAAPGSRAGEVAGRFDAFTRP